MKKKIEPLIRALEEKVEQKETFSFLDTAVSDQEYVERLKEALSFLREEFQKEHTRKNLVASIWGSFGHAFSVIQTGDEFRSSTNLHKKDKYELFDLLQKELKNLTSQAASVD